MVTHLAAGLAIVGWAVVVKAVLYPRVQVTVSGKSGGAYDDTD